MTDPNNLLFAVEVGAYIFAFALTFASGYLVFRQRISSFQIIRDFVLGVYLLIVLLMLLDFARVVTGNPFVMKVYPGFSTSLGLGQAILLSAAAIGVYLHPSDSSFRSFPLLLSKARKHALLFSMFVAIALIATVYVVAISPPPTVNATDFAGRSVPSMSISESSIYLEFVLLSFFLTYPMILLYQSAKKVPNPALRSGLIVLPVGWAIVSLIYVAFETLLWIYGIDYTVWLYALNAIIFFIVTREFRSSAVLGGLVEHARKSGEQMPHFSTRMGRPLGFLRGSNCLVEANPSVPYELTIKEMVQEMLSLKDAVFITTSKGSRVHLSVAALEGINLFTMSSSTNYIVPSARQGEVFMPLYDAPLLLDSFSKVVDSPDSPKAHMVFDNISDMILTIGFEKTYGFLKQALEICSDHNVTFVALIFRNAHDQMIVNAVRSLFSTQLVDDEIGPRVSKYLEKAQFFAETEKIEKEEPKDGR